MLKARCIGAMLIGSRVAFVFVLFFMFLFTTLNQRIISPWRPGHIVAIIRYEILLLSVKFGGEQLTALYYKPSRTAWYR